MYKQPSGREIDAYVKNGGKQCRFCARWCKDKAKWNAHVCVTRRACQNQYREACERYPDFKSRYPRWQEYDIAAESGTYVPGVPVIEDYIGIAPPVPSDAIINTGSDSGEFNPEPGPDDQVQPAGVDTNFVPEDRQEQQPAPESMDVSPDSLPAQPGPNVPRQLTKAVTTLVGKTAETACLAAKKISTKKEWGWRPIILILHELKMWVFKGKEIGGYFKLDVNQIRLLCTGYFNTFGDSPLTRITGKDFDETTIDFLSAELTVYGDFYIEHAPAAIGHGKELLKTLKAWKTKDGDKPAIQGS